MNDADRIEKTILKLKDLLYIKTFSIKNFTKKDGSFTSIEEVDTSYSPWQICGKDSYFGKNSTFAWFRFEFQIPKEFIKRPIALKIRSDDTNSQFIVYVNEVLKFHLMENGEALIKESSEDIIDFKIDVSAIAKSTREDERKLKCYLIVIDEYVKEYLFYLVQSLYIIRRTNVTSNVPSNIIDILNKSIDILNLNEPYSEEFDASVLAAINNLKSEFEGFKSQNNSSDVLNFNFLSPANLNPLFILNSLYLSSSELLNYKMTLNNIRDMSYIKKTYPTVFNDVKEKVKSGNFELVVGVNSSRENSCHGETLIRNIMFKKNFFLEEFNEDINIATFSEENYLHASLPQILKNLGIKYVFLEQKNISDIRRIFTWIGVNGDGVDCGVYREINDNISFKNILNIYNTEKSKMDKIPILSSFDNYEFDKLKIETLCNVSNSIALTPNINFHTFLEESENIKNYLENDLNHYKCFGDLNSIDNKINCSNSKLEILVQSAEVWSVFDHLSGNEYDIDTLNNCWSSMDDVDYVEKMASSFINDIKKKVCLNINSPYYTIVVFNNVSFLRDEIIEFKYDDSLLGKLVKDGHGKTIPYQLNKDDDSRAIFLATNLPPMGYKCFYVLDGPKDERKIFVDKGVIESNTIKLSYDKDGNVTALYDKINDKELILPNYKCNFIEVFEEDPLDSNKKKYVDFQVDPIEVLELGSIRSSIRIRKIFNDSSFEQTIYVYHNISKVDFKTKIHLNDFFDIRAKFEFNINSPQYLCDMPFGIVHKTSGIMNKNFKKNWACIYENNYKIQIANNKNCDMVVEGNSITLILATSKSPSLIEVDYALNLETGFGYENLIRNSFALLSPIETGIIKENKPENPLPYMISMAWVDNDNVILQTLKKAENSDEVVIRVYETDNRQTECMFSFYRILYDVYECDMLEREIKSIESDKNVFKFTIKPNEIKTFKFKVQT